MNKLQKIDDWLDLILKAYLIYGLFYFRFLSFSTGKNEVSTKGPDKLQLLS